MAVQTVNVAPVSSSDALFRVWGLAISNAIVAAGLVKTSDTGQINWTTVVKGTAGTKAGFEIFRFDDALQTTHPVFIRLDYGSNASATSTPQIWVSFGTATDGAGTLAAHASFPLTYIPLASAIPIFNSTQAWNTTTALPIYIDSDGAGSLMIAGWLRAPVANGNYGGTVTIVERTRDMDGAYNDEGIFFTTANGTASTSRVMIVKNAAAIAGQPGGGVAGTPAAITIPYVFATTPVPATFRIGGIQHFHPIFTGATPKLNGPSNHVITVLDSDMQGLQTFDIEHYGVTKKWMASDPGSEWASVALGQLLFRMT